ncbi:MAG: cobalt-zinc-cadmium efflux system membrane fusion protein [Flavobacteriales bacterium]|jgi:cobalt-zinc-cadmium efflux system membrane fusion protein
MRYITIILLTVLLFSNCHNHDHEGHDHGDSHEGHDHGDAAADAGHEEEEEEKEIALTSEQIKNIGLRYEKIESRKIQSKVKLTGRVELPPSGKSIASSNLDGRITKVSITSGQNVKKGQLLFTVENLDVVDWQESLSQAKSQLVYLDKEASRQKALSEESISPLKNYEKTKAEQAETQASIKALETKLRSLGISQNTSENFQTTFNVYAPASGVIQHLMASMGQFINASMPLAKIIDNDHLHLHLNAYGPDITLLEKGQVLKFYVQSRPENILEAKVKWINTLVNEESNSYDVHAEIEGSSKGLSPGEFVEARIINQEQMLATLPIEAITVDKGLKFIFIKEDVHEDETHFAKLQIKSGETDLGFMSVLPIDPIPANAEVVVEGAFFLMAESKKGEAAAGGHSHAH